MIIGLTGAICAGKREFALYLQNKYGFKVVDLLDLFKKELKKRGIKITKEFSPLRRKLRIEGSQGAQDSMIINLIKSMSGPRENGDDDTESQMESSLQES